MIDYVQFANVVQENGKLIEEFWAALFAISCRDDLERRLFILNNISVFNFCNLIISKNPIRMAEKGFLLGIGKSLLIIRFFFT